MDVLAEKAARDGRDVDMLDMSTVAREVDTSTPQNVFPASQTVDASPNVATAVSTTGASLQASAVTIGAGPMPAGWGEPPGSSSLSEFTKRRNWQKLVLDQFRDLYLVLNPDMLIQYASPSCEQLTGYKSDKLKSKFLKDFVHQDDKAMVIREMHGSIASAQQFRFFYRFKKIDSTFAIFESFGHPHFSSDGPDPGVAGEQRSCGGIFMISRPYPTKNASLLDSFLGHKIENERLLRKIEELKREEQEELEAQDQYWASRESRSSVTHSEDPRTEAKADTENGGSVSTFDGMLPPPKPATSNTALTKQNLNEALAASRPDNINDKMARYEGTSPMEHIEMLTGLRSGERSEGISTGAESPALIMGDVGIEIVADRDNRSSFDRKKKPKVADEYVCTDCGTLDSPEWRKGPSGPKTLCNACGLRWAKSEKKKLKSTI